MGKRPAAPNWQGRAYRGAQFEVALILEIKGEAVLLDDVLEP